MRKKPYLCTLFQKQKHGILLIIVFIPGSSHLLYLFATRVHPDVHHTLLYNPSRGRGLQACTPYEEIQDRDRASIGRYPIAEHHRQHRGCQRRRHASYIALWRSIALGTKKCSARSMLCYFRGFIAIFSRRKFIIT